ncbi:hypothetical protein AD998_16205 [bacterium 336/3]|nr:hypothetical protein AD998_16205 [bacterium 336/3]
MSIVIVYHSGYGHTKIVAEYVLKGVLIETPQAILLTTSEAQSNIDLLHQADTIVFGSPTYMGSVSAEFKKFMEFTGKFWYKQPWKNKLAAGFTNSSTLNGDKLNTLQQICLFAAQHSMLWVSMGILPKFENDRQLEEPNGLGSYLGLMTLSNNSTQEIIAPKGLETAELFGKRIAQITHKLKNNHNL